MIAPLLPRGCRWDRWQWVGPLVVGALVRWLYATQVFCSTFDTAVVGLMAMHILHNGERPLFFYGQSYFGALEAWLAAALFKLFGISEEVLTLAAILPSLAWIWLTGRLFEAWQGRVAGLAAAWSLALPGWIVLHYCVGTYGGYPIAFALGTFVLWQAVCIYEQCPHSMALLRPAILVALAAGLALWTHLISLAYLAPAAILIAAALARAHFRWSTLWPWLVSAPLLALGLVPYLAVADMSSFDVRTVVLDLAVWWYNLKGLTRRPLRQQFLYDHITPVAKWFAVGLSALLAILVLVKLFEAPTRKARGRWWWPFAFCGLFLAQYVPHKLATTRAPRYAIPLWTTLLATGLAAAATVQARHWRWVGRLALGMWFTYVAVHTAGEIQVERPKRARELAQRQAVVAAARAAGLRTVSMVDSDLVAHRGAIYTFTALGRPIFVNPYTERHQPSATAAERDDREGFLVHQAHAAHVREALRRLGAIGSEIPVADSLLIFDVRVAPVSGRAVLPDRLRVRTADGRCTFALTDRCLRTSLDLCEARNRTLEISIEPPANLLGLHLTGPTWCTVAHWPRVARCELVEPNSRTTVIANATHAVAPAWTAGPRVYLLGYGGHIEIRCSQPVCTSCVRLEFESVKDGVGVGECTVSEIFLREVADNSIRAWEFWPEALQRLADLADAWKLEFVVSDRWLAARLNEESDQRRASWRAFPRFNPRFLSAWPPRRIAPARGLGIVVPEVWSDELAHVLRQTCPQAQWERTHIGPWVLYRFPEAPAGTGLNPDGPLEWEGTFLLRRTCANDSADQPGHSKISSH